jgi:hypothetical protein
MKIGHRIAHWLGIAYLSECMKNNCLGVTNMNAKDAKEIGQTISEGLAAGISMKGIEQSYQRAVEQNGEALKKLADHMTEDEAIKIIKSNYPPERYSMLREALDLAMKALEERKPQREANKNVR